MRTWGFYGLLVLPILIWAIIVLPNYFLDAAGVSLAVVYAAVRVSPLIGGDLSIFGEVTPILLAGMIIALMPSNKDEIKPVAVGLAVLSYLLFVHLSVFFTSPPGEAILSANWMDIAGPKEIILGLISKFRVMAIVIAGTILGFKVK